MRILTDWGFNSKYDIFLIIQPVIAMNIVSYSYARTALKAVLDRVVHDADVTIISRHADEGDAVVMSLDHYNSLMETLYLLSTPANANALTKAIQQDRAGLSQSRALFNSVTPN